MRALLLTLSVMAGTGISCATPRSEMNAPVAATPGATTESTLEAGTSAPLRRADLVGTWGAAPDTAALWPKIEALMESGLDEETAVMFCFLARIELHDDGSGQFGMGQDGELDGAAIFWEAAAISGRRVDVRMTIADGTLLGVLEVERVDELISISGDPALGGLWMMLERGEFGVTEDLLSHATAVQYMEYRETVKEAMVQVEATFEQQQATFEVLADAVRVICELEELQQDFSRAAPARGEAITSVKQSLYELEGSLIAMDLPNTPKPPFKPEHAESASRFDEAWLASSWRLAIEQLDWSEIMSAATTEEIETAKNVLGTRRSSFEIRGPYTDVFGMDGEQEIETGYHCLVQGQGEWCTVIITIRIGSGEEGMVEYRTAAARAYRVGDTMWMEESAGFLVPWVRAD